MKRVRALVVLIVGLTAVAYGAENIYRVGVDGLACPFCSYGIERRIKALGGVQKVESDIKAGAVTVTMKEGETLTEEQAREAVKEAGFTLRAFEKVSQERSQKAPGQGKR